MMTGAQPQIIQGGMGVAISGWELARTVAARGALGVVSGTALDVVLARRLQDGDLGGHMRRALRVFPFPDVAERVLQRYYVAGGKAAGVPYRRVPMFTQTPSPHLVDLTVLANFAFVWLAREGHEGLVGINYLEKIQMPNLPSVYGAMLAGVDYVLMGAGIPREMPRALDRLARGEAVSVQLHMESAEESVPLSFDPAPFGAGLLKRPKFLAIVASDALAGTLLRKAGGRVDGFVVETPVAGGHNAPPRLRGGLSPNGEPVYGPKDAVDLERMRQLEVPFWLGGGYGHPTRLMEARAAGATGVQIGTAFAFCRESGLDPALRRDLLRQVMRGDATVFTDPLASPTGFPFKVVPFDTSLTNPQIYARRPRHCDLGYLRRVGMRATGKLVYRCPAEPVDAYVSKGGRGEDTVGRKCLCNALMANVGLGQHRPGEAPERPLVTAGDDLVKLAALVERFGVDYSANDVLDWLGARPMAIPTGKASAP